MDREIEGFNAVASVHAAEGVGVGVWQIVGCTTEGEGVAGANAHSGVVMEGGVDGEVLYDNAVGVVVAVEDARQLPLGGVGQAVPGEG